MPSARDDALRLLSRRSLAERELAQRLVARGHPPSDADAVVSALRREGLLDDLALARRALESGAARRGPTRLRRDLERRGVAADAIDGAWRALEEEGAVDPAGTLLREASRRVAAEGGSLDRSAAARVYTALLRAGFEPDAIRAALRPHLRGPEDDP
jgi:regulatory protein